VHFQSVKTAIEAPFPHGNPPLSALREAKNAAKSCKFLTLGFSVLSLVHLQKRWAIIEKFAPKSV